MSFKPGDRVVYTQEDFSCRATIIECYEKECLVQLDVDYVQRTVDYESLVYP